MTDIIDVDLFYEPMPAIVIVSGYFDPLGSHHIELFKAAKKLRQHTNLYVGINSDEACTRKKGQPAFMSWNEKAKIIQELECVDFVEKFDDSDGSACNLLENVYNRFKPAFDADCLEIIFANGGDRRPDGIPIPEESWAKIHYPRIKFAYGVGGNEKTGASSDVLRQWTDNWFAKLKGSRITCFIPEIESGRIRDFIDKQRKDSRSEGCSGGRFSYIITPTSLGTAVSIRDEITKEELNVTDYNMW